MDSFLNFARLRYAFTKVSWHASLASSSEFMKRRTKLKSGFCQRSIRRSKSRMFPCRTESTSSSSQTFPRYASGTAFISINKTPSSSKKTYPSRKHGKHRIEKYVFREFRVSVLALTNRGIPCSQDRFSRLVTRCIVAIPDAARAPPVVKIHTV